MYEDKSWLVRFWPMLRSYAVSTPFFLVAGAWLNQPTPKVYQLSIENPNFPAGDTIRFVRHMRKLPDNCAPQPTRWISYDVGGSTTLGDMREPPINDPGLPTPSHLRLGCGTYNESLSASCGWLSGIFPAAGGHSQPIRVCVLPPRPLDTN